MTGKKVPKDRRPERGNLVGRTADALRDIAFAAEEGELLGSLQDLSRRLGVGVITLQKAARVLEHEGVLKARRGPGGGYSASRPDAASLERLLAGFLRTHPASFGEVLNITSLLFTELCGAAAEVRDPRLLGELVKVQEALRDGTARTDQAAFEAEFQDLLFRMVEWPLFELLTRVTLRFASTAMDRQPLGQLGATDAWRKGRERIVAAIIAGDPELARFEADRSNRRVLLDRFR